MAAHEMDDIEILARALRHGIVNHREQRLVEAGVFFM